MKYALLLFIMACSTWAWGDKALSGSGTAIVRWATPTRLLNNDCAGKIDKYLIHYGNEKENFDTIKELEADRVICSKIGVDSLCGLNISTCTHTLFDLGKGEWYFRVQAIDINGNKSTFSNKATKKIK